MAMLHGCTIQDDVLVGMKAMVMDSKGYTYTFKKAYDISWLLYNERAEKYMTLHIAIHFLNREIWWYCYIPPFGLLSTESNLFCTVRCLNCSLPLLFFMYTYLEAVVQPNVIIGAGALVPPGKVLESGFLYVGSPCKKVRELEEKELQWIQ